MNKTQAERNIKSRLAAFCLCAGLLLCVTVQGMAEQQPEAAASVQDAMTAYEAVLLEQQPYLQAGADGAGESVFSAQPDVWYGYELDGRYTVSRFCVTDLDADGLPEVILDLSDAEGYPFGYELLRYEAGTVYGFGFGLRAMEVITLEGDIAFSDGAADNGWYQLRFAADQLEPADICRMQSTGETIQYCIGDEEVSQEDYLAFTAQMEQKPQPVWMELTDETVRYVVSQCKGM